MNEIEVRKRIGDIRSLMLRPDVLAELESIGRNIQPSQFVRIALSQLRKTPKLLECSQASFLNSLLRLAAIGLDCDGQQASLVPFNGECTLIIGYPGYITLAYRHPRIVKVEVHLVFQSESFDPRYGQMAGPIHVVNLQRSRNEAPCGAYAVAWLRSENGDTLAPLVEYMDVQDIDAIREKAPSYPKKDGAHQQHPNEMRRKTVLRRLAKYLPRTPEMARALESDEVPAPSTADFDRTTAQIEQDLLTPKSAAVQPTLEKVLAVGPANIEKAQLAWESPRSSVSPTPVVAEAQDMEPDPNLIAPEDLPSPAPEPPPKPTASDEMAKAFWERWNVSFEHICFSLPHDPHVEFTAAEFAILRERWRALETGKTPNEVFPLPSLAPPPDLAARREKMFKALAAFGMSREQVYILTCRGVTDEISANDITFLQSVWSRLNSGETTVAKLFPGPINPYAALQTAAEANAMETKP